MGCIIEAPRDVPIYREELLPPDDRRRRHDYGGDS